MKTIAQALQEALSAMQRQHAATYTCPKCSGSGHLSQYAGIAGGVCFSCQGRGFKYGRAPVPGTLYGISAIRRDDGVRIVVFHKKARTEAQALKKAIETLKRGNGYIPESAQITHTTTRSTT